MGVDQPADDGGLRYWPVYAYSLDRPIWVLDDAEGPAVDVRSVIEVLGMSWRRWTPVLTNRKNAWRLEGSLDRRMRETRVVDVRHFMRLLGELQQTVDLHHAAAGQRLRRLRNRWGAAWKDAFDSHTQGLSDPRLLAAAKLGHKPRKVNAEKVRQLYNLWLDLGDVAAASAAVGISRTAGFAVRSGTYEFWDEAARECWETTFGAGNGRRTVQNQSRTADRKRPGRAAPPDPCSASDGAPSDDRPNQAAGVAA